MCSFFFFFVNSQSKNSVAVTSGFLITFPRRNLFYVFSFFNSLLKLCHLKAFVYVPDLFFVTYSLHLLISHCWSDFQIMHIRIKAGKIAKTNISGVQTPKSTALLRLQAGKRVFYFQRLFLLHLPLMHFPPNTQKSY